MRLALDHHYSPKIAAGLRDLGHDVVAANERGWEQLDDESLLEECAREGRALLSNNVADFAVIVRDWAAVGRSHAGVVFTSDASLPRGRHTIGRFISALDALCVAHPSDSALIDTIRWLA